jgi:hypothetical protein
VAVLVVLGYVMVGTAGAENTGAAAIRLGVPTDPSPGQNLVIAPSGSAGRLSRDAAASLTAILAAADTCPPVAPCILIQPAEETVTAGETAVFEASATGEPTPSVQWEVSTDNGATWADDLVDPGDKTELLRVENTSIAENGWKYRAVFHNEAGTTTSEAARLTIDVVPAVTTNPVDQAVTAGETATFKAAASGKPPPGTQWQVSANGGASFANDTADAGSTTGTLKVERASVAENGLGACTGLRTWTDCPDAPHSIVCLVSRVSIHRRACLTCIKLDGYRKRDHLARLGSRGKRTVHRGRVDTDHIILDCGRPRGAPACR